MTEIKTNKLGNMNFLVIEDDPDTLMLLAKIITRNGGHALTAITAKDAMYAVAQHQFNYILSDVMLPDMSGYDLWEKIRQSEKCALVPIIAVTKLKDWKDKVASHRAGAAQIIEKPVHELVLVEVIKAMVREEMRILQRNTKHAPVADETEPVLAKSELEMVESAERDENAQTGNQATINHLTSLVTKLGRRFQRVVDLYEKKEYVRMLDILYQEKTTSTVRDNGLAQAFDLVEQEYMNQAVRSFGSWDNIPKVVTKQLNSEILATFRRDDQQVLHLIDSKTSFTQIAEFCRLDRWRTIDVLLKFLREGYIKIYDPVVDDDVFIVES